jgi:UDP-N-acetylglucosamine--N-acetylmuramyl-(pentapeptide) pyrophosphoryl-undecaprenol N-acetylglucosamine transferase
MCGGGTGGHLTIIKSVKEQLLDSDLVYIGSTNGQDRAWFGDDNSFRYKYFLESRGVVNQNFFGKIKSIFMLIKAIREAMRLLNKHNAKVVFSVGGFSSAPTAFASKIRGIPLVIHEQNAHIGSLNTLLKPFADIFISSYIDESPIEAYPIKDIFFENAHIRDNIKTIMFLGGSQGAKAINTLAISLAPKLKEMGIKIIHQAGEGNIDEMAEEYKKLNIDVEIFGFSRELDRYMNMADFAIARAGASTLWELSALGIPTLYIPYPYASKDHQYHNAKYFVDKKLAWVMREDNIDRDKIIEILNQDMGDRSRGLIDSVKRDGSREIAKLLKEM